MKKTIRVKQPYVWQFAFSYFEMFRSYITGEILADKEFQNKFEALIEHIVNKIQPPYDADMNIYVVLEQQIDIEKYSNEKSVGV